MERQDDHIAPQPGKIIRSLGEQRFPKLAGYLRRLLDIGIPCLDLSVCYKGEACFRFAGGHPDLARKHPVCSDTLYYLYSSTKLVTCVAALQLYERGRLALQAPVADYLPEFSNLNVQLPNGTFIPVKEPMRIIHLLTMTAGLTYDLHTPQLEHARQITGGKCDTRTVMRAIANTPLHNHPGTCWEYGLCHDVLGGIIEVISGERYRDYVRQNIFDPCGMADSYFELNGDQNSRLAAQFRNVGSGTEPVFVPEVGNEYVFGSSYDCGGAGMISTTDDYMRFLNALCYNGLTASGKYLLEPVTIELMRKNFLSKQQLQSFSTGVFSGYGYGLGVRTRLQNAASGAPIGEYGWSGAGGAYILVDPKNEITMFYIQQVLDDQIPNRRWNLRDSLYEDFMLSPA